jgi:hypothetical protein
MNFAEKRPFIEYPSTNIKWSDLQPPLVNISDARACAEQCVRAGDKCAAVVWRCGLSYFRPSAHTTRPFSPAGSCALKTKSEPRVADNGATAIVRQCEHFFKFIKIVLILICSSTGRGRQTATR